MSLAMVATNRRQCQNSAVDIRKARRKDWHEVVPLLVQLGLPEFADPKRASSFQRRFFAYLRRRDTVALVAQADQRVVGFLNMEFRERFSQTHPQAWMANLVVDEVARGSGLGVALFSAAEAIARERGCRWLMLESASERTESHTFFAARGMAERGKSFAKRL